MVLFHHFDYHTLIVLEHKEFVLSNALDVGQSQLLSSSLDGFFWSISHKHESHSTTFEKQKKHTKIICFIDKTCADEFYHIRTSETHLSV